MWIVKQKMIFTLEGREYKMWKKETDLDEIKKTCLLLYDCVPIKNNKWGMCNHPFIDSLFYTNGGGEIVQVDEDNKEGLEALRNQFNATLNRSKSLMQIYIMVRTPYKLTWLKFCKDFMSKKDFSEFLSYCWVEQENPNQDKNVSKRECISYFKKADKKVLMSEEDFKYYNNIKDKVVVYRGVAIGRERLGLSWTDDLQKATWFQNRFNHGEDRGYLLRAVVDKSNVLAYLNSRNERELVVDVFKIKNLIKEI